MLSAQDILHAHAQTVSGEIERLLAGLSDAPARLVESIGYSLLAGGKRLRPALVLECAKACHEQLKVSGVFVVNSQSNTPDPFNSIFNFTQSSKAAAVAIELIHTFSLIHDDLPAMDDDDLRRGRPTNHKVFGEAMAILAGDAMTTLAFEVIAQQADPAIAPRLILELARASGPIGMIGGQVLDMAGENQSLSINQLQAIHRLKTGALLTCACRMGAMSAGAAEDRINALTHFGDHLGLAFQIVDDLLDVTSTPEQLGKATGKDATRGKNTYPALMGIESSRSEALKNVELAVDALTGFGPSADGLRAIARFVVARKC